MSYPTVLDGVVQVVVVSLQPLTVMTILSDGEPFMLDPSTPGLYGDGGVNPNMIGQGFQVMYPGTSEARAAKVFYPAPQ